MPRRLGLWGLELLGEVMLATMVVVFFVPIANTNFVGWLFTAAFWGYFAGVVTSIAIAICSNIRPRPKLRYMFGWPWWAHRARQQLHSPP